MLLLIFWMNLPAAHAQYGSAQYGTTQIGPSQEQMKQTIETIDNAHRDLKKLAQEPDSTCWECAFKEKQICEFNDLCQEVKGQSMRAKLYQSVDGSYVPNFALSDVSSQLNLCRWNARNYAATLPSAQQDQWKAYNQRMLQLMQRFEKRGLEKAFFQLTRGMYEDPPPGAAQTDPKKRFEQTLAQAEKRAKQKIPADLKHAWIDFLAPAQPAPVLPEIIDVNDDPLLNFNRMFSPQLGEEPGGVKKNQARYSQQYERTQKIFDEVQKGVIAVIEKRRTKDNGPEIDNLVRRLKTVKMVPELNPAECPDPNAFYRPASHDIHICPQIMMMPKEALETVLAHEFGHSVDSCVSSQRLSRAARMSVVTDPPPASAYYQPFNPPKHDPDPSHDYFVNGGAKSEDEDEVAPGVDPFSYPLNSVVSCLSGADSVQANQGEVSSDLERLRKLLQMVNESGGAGSDKAKILENQVRQLEEASQSELVKRCSATGSQLQEATADWIATEYIASRMADETPAARRQIFEATSYFSATSCMMDVLPEATAAILSSCPMFQNYATASGYGGGHGPRAGGKTSAKGEDEHPFSSSRINRILLAHPVVREKLGCPSTAVKHCE